MANSPVSGPAAFLADCCRRGLSTVICWWRDEYGPDSRAKDPTYGQIREAGLLAYHAGELLAWQHADWQRAALLEAVEQSGLRAVERCRNSFHGTMR